MRVHLGRTILAGGAAPFVRLAHVIVERVEKLDDSVDDPTAELLRAALLEEAARWVTVSLSGPAAGAHAA